MGLGQGRWGGGLPLWVCGSHVGPCGQARACSWAFPVWCKDQDGGLRPAESGLQPPHAARSWSEYLGLAWAAFHADGHNTKAQEKAFTTSVSLHARGNSTVKPEARAARVPERDLQGPRSPGQLWASGDGKSPEEPGFLMLRPSVWPKHKDPFQSSP